MDTLRFRFAKNTCTDLQMIHGTARCSDDVTVQGLQSKKQENYIYTQHAFYLVFELYLIHHVLGTMARFYVIFITENL